MDARKWERAKELFGSALEREPAQRSAFLAEACGGDESLRQEVESLLAAHQDVASTAVTAMEESLSATDIDEDRILGRRIGTYQVMKRIGEGGMAAVYLAFRADDQYRKQVAIKLVPLAMATRELVQRFRNERQTLAALEHPNIVRLLDGGTTEDGRPYLVMEYVEGTPITEYADTHRLSITERLQLFRTVCSAVSYAHQKLIIHRDLKPSNILVTADGTLKLLDFGIAKLLNPEMLAEKLAVTQAGQRLMTPEYASPEQVHGEPLTNASDIYSLGAVLYELLTGHQLYRFKTYTITEIEHLICEEEPNKPSTVVTQAEEVVWPGGVKHKTITPEEVGRRREDKPERLRRKLQGDLDTIVMMALRKEPQRRYASAYELSEDIRNHLEGLPVKARPSTAVYRATKFLRRHKEAAATALAFVTLATLALVVAALIWYFNRPVAPSSSPAQQITIAVLPLQNLGSDKEADFLRLALPDEIATTLSYVRALSIRPFASANKYTGPNVDLQQAGREMHVKNIVTGHFLKEGNELQVTLEAVDVENDRVIWHDNLSGAAADLVSLRAQITGRVRQALVPALGGATESNDSQTRPQDEEAYDLYLRSLAISHDGAANKEGIASLERAVGRDPNYAPAWANLGLRYYYDAHYTGGGSAMYQRSGSAFERALALDPNLILAAGQLTTSQADAGDLEGAYRQALNLLKRRPENGYAHFILAYVLRYAGLLREATQECDVALRLDPGNYQLRSCAVAFLTLGKTERARTFVNLDVGSDWGNYLTATILMREGKLAEADAVVQRLSDNPFYERSFLNACVQHRSGSDFDRLSRETETSVSEIPDPDPEPRYYRGALLVFCNQPEIGWRMIESAIQRNYCSLEALQNDPLLAKSRQTPEFPKLLSEAKACQDRFLSERKQN